MQHLRWCSLELQPGASAATLNVAFGTDQGATHNNYDSKWDLSEPVRAFLHEHHRQTGAMRLRLRQVGGSMPAHLDHGERPPELPKNMARAASFESAPH